MQRCPIVHSIAVTQLNSEILIAFDSCLTHSPCFCFGGSQAAVAYVVALEGRGVILQLLKVHDLLYLEAHRTPSRKALFGTR